MVPGRVSGGSHPICTLGNGDCGQRRPGCKELALPPSEDGLAQEPRSVGAKGRARESRPGNAEARQHSQLWEDFGRGEGPLGRSHSQTLGGSLPGSLGSGHVGPSRRNGLGYR